MDIPRYRFNPEEKKLQKIEDKAEEVEKVGIESEKSVETGPEKISTAEFILGAVALGIRAKLFLDDKGAEVRGVIEEAKKDILTEPTEAKPVFGRSIADIGSLIVDHIREEKERKLTIRQSFVDSVNGLTGKLNQLKMVEDFEEIQRQDIAKTVRTPIKVDGLSEEEKTKLREKIEVSKTNKEKHRKESLFSFVNGLLKL